MSEEETRLDTAPAGKKTSPSSSGWLSSSGAIDHGRFTPGTLLGGRYRIVERLGRGGMGEVYRADDLKLGQPVALKFLPPEVDRDPARLTQLHTEVRMTRQVSHPNVCRVYDIDEVDGHTFLSMEYVDGEELGTLLRRIGRFPAERALELSRQICAGLAAAHERGVVHRDLKPANVMLDGTGKVRITDFGLAGLAGESLRAGTPAYMAPEQLAGGEVTARSDIYALGLVLYELFTGQRALEAANLAELIRKREEAGVTPPSEIVRELDPAIDRAILRCLEPEPSKRPSSALAVAAAFPGGDPLAAALAAGETPSPAMVAAAGEMSALRPMPAVAGLATALIVLLAIAALSDRTLLTGYVPTAKPPAVLEDRAREVARALGYADTPADTARGFTPASDYLRFARQRGAGAATREHLRAGRPAGLLYWHRSSPRQMVPTGNRDRVSLTDPPFTMTGMIAMTLDTEGRLDEFHAVPPQVEDSASGTPVRVNWTPLFALAGLPQADFRPVTPQWTPRSHSDERAAWEGPMPGWPEQRLRVEAAAYRGRPVYFQTIGPWTEPARMRERPRSRVERWAQTIIATAVLLVLGVAAIVARHNLRKGRGDRRGALRFATLVFVSMMVAWILGAEHIAAVNIELGRIFEALGWALFCAGVLWVLYHALEPYVRKFWPATLISWSRLLAGRIIDPIVGRDVLIGVLAGLMMVLLSRIDFHIRPLLGYPAPPPLVTNVDQLEGFRQTLTTVGDVVFSAAFNSLWIVFGFVAITLIVRRVWITAIVMTAFLMLTGIAGVAETPPVWLGLVFGLAGVSTLVFVLLRFGLLTVTVLFVTSFLIASSVITLDTSKWFFPTSTTLLLIVAGLAVYGFYASRGGEPLLGRRILD
jgi:hypothetical protein